MKENGMTNVVDNEEVKAFEEYFAQRAKILKAKEKFLESRKRATARNAERFAEKISPLTSL